MIIFVLLMVLLSPLTCDARGNHGRGSYDVFDKGSNRIGYVRDGAIYDKGWNKKGYIKNNQVYDEKWNREGSYKERK